MIFVRDLPCFWRAPETAPAPAPLRVAKYFPNAKRLDPSDFDGLHSSLKSETQDWVLLLEKDILPYSTLPMMQLDTHLTNGNYPYALLSRNLVTNEYEAGHGPTLWPRKTLLKTLENENAVPHPSAVLPVAKAQWYCNPDAETAFSAAFLSVSAALPTALTDDAVRHLSLRASVGSDSKFGTAWIVGACHALLGHKSLVEVLSTEIATLASQERTTARARELARRVRLNTGFRVLALDPGESRLIKDTAFAMPPPDHYLALARVFDKMGGDTREAAKLYREAANWLWGNRSVQLLPDDLIQ